MKTNYEGFRGWINYVRDYKDNKDNDLISANEVIKANNKMDLLNNKMMQYQNSSFLKSWNNRTLGTHQFLKTPKSYYNHHYKTLMFEVYSLH